MARDKKVVLPNLEPFLKVRKMDIVDFYNSLTGKNFDSKIEEAQKKFIVTTEMMVKLKEASKVIKALEDKVVVVEVTEEHTDKPEKKKRKKESEEMVSEEMVEETKDNNEDA